MVDIDRVRELASFLAREELAFLLAQIEEPDQFEVISVPSGLEELGELREDGDPLEADPTGEKQYNLASTISKMVGWIMLDPDDGSGSILVIRPETFEEGEYRNLID